MTVGEDVVSLDAVLAEINRDYGRPGLVAGVTDQHRLLALGATGVRRLGGDAKVAAADPFHIGSIAKPIAATVIAVLVDQGGLSWEATPAAVFGRSIAGIHPALRDVPIGWFLSHRAGLAGYTEDEQWLPFAGWIGTPAGQRARFAAHVLAEPPAVTPGGELHYSNAGFAVAAAMAERATGRAWEELMRACVLAPLEMTSAGFGWPARDGVDAPYGHWEAGETFRPDEAGGSFVLGPMLGPAGDLHMNVADLASFARVHLLALAGEDTLVRADNIQALYRDLGYYERSSQRVRYSGSAGTFVAVLSLQPPLGRAVVLMANAGDADDSLSTEVLDTLVARFPDLSGP